MAPPLRIKGNLFDPVTDGPLLEPALDPADTNYILIQTERRMNGEEIIIIEKLQCDPGEVLDSHICVCRYEPADLTPIRNLPFVKWVGVYHPSLKIQSHMQYPNIFMLPGLQRQSAPNAGPAIIREILTVIVIYRNAGVTTATLARQLLDEGIIDGPPQFTTPDWIHAVVHITKLRAIASIDYVRSVEEYQQPEWADERSRMAVGSFLHDPPGPNLQIVNNVEYTGAGQVINIVDTGFDNGDPANLPPGYEPHRLRQMYNPWYQVNPTANDFRDTYGHGTHVCGCALLNAKSDSMGGVDCNQPGLVRGTAPEADFVITNGGSAAGLLWPNFRDLVERPYYNDHARISNHSYAPSVPQKPYSASNEQVDQYIYDHDDLVVTYAAGNGGSVPNYGYNITGEPASKNVITVGGTFSPRKMRDGVSFDASASQEADLHDTHGLSSRGPTHEGRIKPDLVAPGFCVLSSLSRSAPFNAACGISTDPNLVWESGTSMSAPCVAGCAAVVRQALQRFGTNSPSAALVKALLINGAVGMSTANDRPRLVPNNDEGFGRVNLGGTMLSIPPSASGGYYDKPWPLRDLDTSPPVILTIPARRPLTPGGDVVGRTLKVTLVWTDRPGGTLVNYFGLAVEIPNVMRRHGNMGPDDRRGRPYYFDAINNVQQVEWRDVPAGLVEITVHCTTSYKGWPANYSLAWSLE